MNDLYIGIDGGGTHTSAVAVRPDGRVRSRAEGAGLNWLNDGLETCVRRFGELLNRLLPSDGDGGTICAGLAALDGPASGEILAAFQSAAPAGYRLLLESDLSVALAGHTLGHPGLMAVCGTGSMVLVRDRAGRETCAGGWGWKMGDPGSGYMLAREGLFRAAFLAEAENRETPLLSAALAFFSAPNLRSLIAPLYAPGQGAAELAAFGAEVIRLAEREDPEALEILTRQMDQLAALAAALLCAVPEAAERVGLSGGLFGHSSLARSLFSRALQSRCPKVKISRIARAPEVGAAALAMLRSGVSAENIPAFSEEPAQGTKDSLS